MRWLVAICTVLGTGCLYPSNTISGRWNVGGEGGCIAGDIISIEVPDDHLHDGYVRVHCTEKRFSIDVDTDLTEFSVVFDVWPLANREVDIGATVQLTRVIDDFNVGLVTFVPIYP